MASIYFHIPFCDSKCNYCDFFSIVGNWHVNKIVDNEIFELEIRAKYIDNQVVKSIYFGGGTPSILKLDHLQKLISAVYKNFIVSKDCEITLEANPEHLNFDFLNGIVNIGFNRLSIGIQSFNDRILSFLGRNHNSSNLYNVIDISKIVGLLNISVDIIYGIPEFSFDDYKETLNAIIKLEVPHISAYCLTIENNTKFHKYVKNKTLIPINDEDAINQFDYTIDILSNSGYSMYEISNFSLNGYESVHNSSYWKNVHYLGIGPSAHSYNGYSRQWNYSNLNLYSHKLMNNESFFDLEILSIVDLFNEYLITGLRTSNGISLNDVKYRYGVKYLEYLELKLENNIINHYVIRDCDRLRLSHSGLLILDFILRDLVLINE